MPAVSEKQRKWAGWQLARKRAGKPTQTKMSESQLKEFASGRARLNKPNRKRFIKGNRRRML